MRISRTLTHTIPLTAALLITPAFARAQAGEQRPTAYCDPSRAVALVQEQLSEAKAFDGAGRRLNILTRAADLLWPHEREAARDLFTQAYELAVKDFREHENDPAPQTFPFTPKPDQRFAVMTAIARRDPAWARRLAEEVAEERRRAAGQSAEASSAAERGTSGVAVKTLDLAQSLLPVDRGAALALARGTFRFPASYALMFFLFKLAETDRVAADTLFREALAAYDGRGAGDLAYLSVYPFALNREPAPVPVGVYYRPPPGFAPGAGLRELFLESLFRQVESVFKTPEVARPEKNDGATEHELLLTLLTTLEPHIARTSPALLERALALRGAAAAAASQKSRLNAEATARHGREYDDQGMFERAEYDVAHEANPEKRDFAVVKVVLSARRAEEFARAEALLDKVSDSDLRRKVASYLYFRWTQQAVKDGQLDEAARLSQKVEELDYRALLSFEIAGAALKRLDDRARAAELLDAVAAEALKAPDTPGKARALLGVAHLYTEFDATRAAQVLRAAVKVINLLPNPDFSSETVERQLGNAVFTTYAVYNMPGMKLENAFRELGARDFESALSAAVEVADKYQRALGVLGLASKCLENAPKPEKPAGASKSSPKPTPASKEPEAAPKTQAPPKKRP
ncbi:MAG TPA: hypothetical protein VFZ44_06240 [Pyrinomonadaceae bacterium]